MVQKILETEFVFFAPDEMMKLSLLIARSAMFITKCETLIQDPTKIGVPAIYFSLLNADEYETFAEGICHAAFKAFLGLALEKGSIDQAIVELDDESVEYYVEYINPSKMRKVYDYLRVEPKEAI